MSITLRELVGGVIFTVLWTAGMIWWTAPDGTGPLVALIIGGIIAGVLWTWLMHLWMRWMERRNLSKR